MAPNITTLYPVRPSDATTLVLLERAAFASEPFTQLAFGPDCDSQANLDFRVDRLTKRIKEAEERETTDEGEKRAKSQRIMMAVLQDVEGTGETQGEGDGEGRTTGKMVGYAQWEYHWEDKTGKADENGEAQPAELVAMKPSVVPDADAKKENKGDSPWPPGSNVELCKNYFGRCMEFSDKYIGGKRMAFLNSLVVLPEYQRQGIGSLLVKDGLDKADAAGLPAWLGATKYGIGLYKKFGFEEVHVIRLNMGEYGGEGWTQHVMMLRPAQSTG